MRFSLSPIIAAGTSAAASFNSVAVDSSYLVASSLQAVVTGTSTGTLTYQVSNDSPDMCTTSSTGALVPTNWTPLTSQTVSVTGAGNFLIPKFDTSYRWMRIAYVATNAAAGTIRANMQSISV